jgi:hypothetical protein
MTVTPTHLSRAAGLSAVVSGLLFALVQFIHPLETVANVDTGTWAITHYLSFTMCVAGLAGVTGIYLRQIREAGLLGLACYLMFSGFFVVTAWFQFVEAFVMPELTDDAPRLVTYFLGIGTGEDTGDLGAVTSIYALNGALYVIGGLAFAAATFRARILARWPSVVLAAGTVITLTIPLVPHSVARVFALPVAAAMVGFGLSLWRSHRSSTAAVATPALAVR